MVTVVCASAAVEAMMAVAMATRVASLRVTRIVVLPSSSGRFQPIVANAAGAGDGATIAFQLPLRFRALFQYMKHWFFY